ncbi:autophagy protein Apg6-domain-containing protein [Tuber indicum]|nr:autophagy protein Apg6-domain-containing protein [Tuber indicum]
MKCQKCRQTIRLHGSLEDLSPAAFNLLVGSSANERPHSVDQASTPQRPTYPQDRRDVYEKASRNSPAPLFKHMVQPKHPPSLTAPHSRQNSKSIYQNPVDSYVMLSQSQVVPPTQTASRSTGSSLQAEYTIGNDHDQNALSQQMRTSAVLFDILSSRSDIDHPICQECSEMLTEGLAKRYANVTRERDAYVDYLKRVNAEIPTDAEREAAAKELEELKAQAAAELRELQDMEQEKADVEAEIKALEEEKMKLDKEEQEFWREKNSFSLRLEAFQNERDGVNLQYDHDSRQLEKLQRTNVYNDTFCIGHDGYFGTINGLRLGRLPNQPVEWTEINAAWGQTLLLLATIAEKLNFTFDSYRLKPMGSCSKIERLDPPTNPANEPKITVLELFSSGDLPLGRMFMHRKFDQAMMAFLECLRQLGEFVERTDSQVKLPYKIVKEKIGDSCIRLAFNQDEAWTRACKYTLTCVKFLLAHTSNAKRVMDRP